MKVSIIICSLNVREILRENLTKLFAQKILASFEVIVIDNGSKDETTAMLKNDFKRVHRIRNEKNTGFAFACNQGLKIATGDILLLLNPDMLVGKGAIDSIVTLLESRKDIGVVGVHLTRPDGTLVESVRRDPQFVDQLAILLKLPHLFPNLVATYLAKDFDYATSKEVDQVRGSFFAFRRDVLDTVGLFDAKNFFVWFEEVDFCKRVRNAGFKIWYSADVSCTDLVGQTFRQQSSRIKQSRFSKSLARYFWKWHPKYQSVIFFSLRPFVIGVGALIDLVHIKSRLWK